MANTFLQNRLALLDAKHKRTPIVKPLRVFYGWARINKIRKKEAISVVFENEEQREEKTMRFIKKMMDVVYVRLQTEDEKKGADKATRMFSEYSLFMADKHFKGSLELALKHNSEADANNVSPEERELIKQKLREHYLSTHPGYKEPTIQLEIDFLESVKS